MARGSKRGSSSSSSGESIHSDTIENSSVIIRVVKATMVVSGELGVRFALADEQFLTRMVELEIEEYRRSQKTVGET